MDLESIFDDYETKDDEFRTEFLFSLKSQLHPDIVIDNMPKDGDYASKVVSYLRQRKIAIDGERDYSSFESTLKHKINPESLKDAFYGLYVPSHSKAVPRAIPLPILDTLGDIKNAGFWALVYFAAGINENKFSKRIIYSDHTLYGIVRSFELNGIESIKAKNSSMKKKGQFGSNGLFLPYESDLKNYFHIPNTKVKQYSGEIQMEPEEMIDHNRVKEDISPDFWSTISRSLF